MVGLNYALWIMINQSDNKLCCPTLNIKYYKKQKISKLYQR